MSQYESAEADALRRELAMQRQSITHFNQLTPAEAERLALLSEECAEVIQAIGKIQRHGYESQHPDGGPTNRELLEAELGDVGFAICLLLTAEDLAEENVVAAAGRKAEKVWKYLHHQEAVREAVLAEM